MSAEAALIILLKKYLDQQEENGDYIYYRHRVHSDLETLVVQFILLAGGMIFSVLAGWGFWESAVEDIQEIPGIWTVIFLIFGLLIGTFFGCLYVFTKWVVEVRDWLKK